MATAYFRCKKVTLIQAYEQLVRRTNHHFSNLTIEKTDQDELWKVKGIRHEVMTFIGQMAAIGEDCLEAFER